MGLVFVAGGLCGAAGLHVVQRHLMRRAMQDPEFVVRTLCRRMESQVGLTAEQRGKCDAELRSARRQFVALHEELHPRIREIFAGTRDHLCAMLTPAQKPKFNALLSRWESAHDAIAPPFLTVSSAGSAPAHEGSAPNEGCSQ
jgi:hypothetical protein